MKNGNGRKLEKTSSATEILFRRYLKDNPEALEETAVLREEMQIGGRIHELRHAAGLTQKELAERVGTSHSAIGRMERADYQGYSLAILTRLADALGKELRVEFVEPPASRAHRQRAWEARAQRGEERPSQAQETLEATETLQPS